MKRYTHTHTHIHLFEMTDLFLILITIYTGSLEHVSRMKNSKSGGIIFGGIREVIQNFCFSP